MLFAWSRPWSFDWHAAIKLKIDVILASPSNVFFQSRLLWMGLLSVDGIADDCTFYNEFSCEWPRGVPCLLAWILSRKEKLLPVFTLWGVNWQNNLKLVFYLRNAQFRILVSSNPMDHHPHAFPVRSIWSSLVSWAGQDGGPQLTGQERGHGEQAGEWVPLRAHAQEQFGALGGGRSNSGHPWRQLGQQIVESVQQEQLCMLTRMRKNIKMNQTTEYLCNLKYRVSLLIIN